MLHLNEKLEECKNLQEQLDDLYQDYDILQSNATMDFKDNSEYWGSLAETDNEAVKVKKNKKMIRLRKKLRDRGGIEIQKINEEENENQINQLLLSQNEIQEQPTFKKDVNRLKIDTSKLGNNEGPGRPLSCRVGGEKLEV